MNTIYRLLNFSFFLLYVSLTNAASVETLDGLAKIPLDIYKSNVKDSPTIVYAHGCSGYDNFDIQKARQIRSWGYNVVVAEYTVGRGVANQTDSNGKNVTCSQGWRAYPMQLRADDLIAVGNWILKQEWHKGKLGAIGFSLGGGAVEYLVNTTNRPNPYAAGVAFYPYCRYVLSPTETTLPNQFHIPALDEGVEKCIGLNKQENRHTIFLYEGATHAFDNDWGGTNRNGYRYDREATTLAFERVKTFFDAQIKN